MARKKNVNDEFFTQLKDIEYELRHYKHEFRDKVVYMNSDHPERSEFWTYFYYNFNYLGLKEVWATYRTEDGSPSSIFKYDGVEITEEPLQSDGDMLGEECLGLLKEADVLVTGPPFSILRELIHKLIELETDYVIIGRSSVYSYKGMLDYMKSGKLNLGYGRGVTIDFEVPEGHKFDFIDSDKRISRRGGLTWMTSYEVNRSDEELILYREYYKNPELYSKYDNIDILNVDKVKEIPIDYYDYMGVPIGFIEKWNKDEFEVIGLMSDMIEYDSINRDKTFNGASMTNGVKRYMRIIIKRRDSDE